MISGFENRTFWRRVLVICGLSGAAVAAPLLDIYGRNPEVFVANRTSGPEIVLFGLIVGLAAPLLALGILLLARWIGGRAPGLAYRVMLVVLSLSLGFVVSRQIFADSTAPAVLAAVGVAALVLAVERWFQGLLGYFALGVPIVLIVFLATSASARLIWEEPAAAEGSAPISDPAPIVMIQLDEMPLASIMQPDGSVNESLFPSFARLADEGTWYRNALSDSIATTQSVPAILTGKLGEKGMSPSSVDHPDNLFTLLAGGYEMHVIEWIADLCPDDVCPDYAGRAPARFSSLLRDVGVVYGHLTFPGALREELPAIDNAWKGFLGQDGRQPGTRVDIDGLPVPEDGSRAEWVDWLQRIADGVEAGAPPTLHYAHLEAPHVPWQTNPSGTHYERPEEYTEVEGVGGDGRWTTDPRPALIGFQRHLYQVGFLDTALGRLFRRLDETSTWDRAMVIVVADHGASFEPGEHRRWPYEENRDDLYRVPLFIKYPGQSEGRVVDAPAFGIDILPTVVDTLGIETTWEFDGMSLLDVEGTDRPHRPIWWCCNGEPASTDLDVLFAQVERNHRWVPRQGDFAEIAGAGRHAGLIGEPAARFDVSEVEDLRWSLELGTSLSDLDYDDGMVQTLLTGRIELPEAPVSDEILITVNGRIAGSGYIRRDSATGGVLRALISEELLADGHNQIDVLVATTDDRWLAGSPDVLTVDLRTADGEPIDLRDEGSRRVQVDEVVATPDGWQLTGWAADISRKETPETIYVFVGSDLVGSGPPDRENSNVVRWFESEDLLLSGFAFDIPSSDIPEGVEQVTVVAEFADAAVADPVVLPG